MQEQTNSTTARSRILVVYGYHPDETFHQEVAIELQKKDLPNITFSKYEGVHLPREKDRTHYPFNKFVKNYHPIDYALQLHDSPNFVDIPETKLEVPYFWFLFDSKIPRTTELISDLDKYQLNLEEKSNRWVLNRALLPRRDSPKNFAYVSVEFFPKYVTKKEAIEQLEGLINILYCHPLHQKV